MGNASSRQQAIIENFCHQLASLFGQELQSIVLYGSAAGQAYHPKQSDFNFMVVLSENGLKALSKTSALVKKWKKNRTAMPLFVSQEYIQNSLDSFPVEFLNIQSSYKVITGIDVMADIRIDKQDVRLQCERELKGKLLHLREEYILTQGKTRAMKQLISRSIPTFTAIFNALLFLSNKPIPDNKQATILDACKEFKEIDETLFSDLLKVRSGDLKLKRDELVSKIELYIHQIQLLSQTIDQLTL